MYSKRILSVFSLVIVVAMLLASCGAPAAPETVAPAAKEITIYHWWTAGGEKQAMDVIFKHFTAANPDIKIVDNPVAGGGGITLKTVMQGMLAAGMPPDTFQTLSGSELKMYVDGGYIEPVDDIWKAQNLDTNYPAVVGQMVTFDGKKMAIPVSIHRANWLFYNVKLFSELGLQPPTDVDELIAVAKTIKEKKPDVSPIGLGTRDKWTAIFLFDVVLLSVGGADKYEQFYTGKLDPATDPTIKTAFEKYAELIPYLYPYHGAKSWSDIPGPLAQGQIAMYVLGDFAAGQLIAGGYKEGTDWEAVAFPQKPEEVFLMIVDCFTRPKGIKHPEATTAWLNNLTDPKTQAEFTIIKGSIAASKLVPASNYPDSLHQRDSDAWANKRIVPASAHGALAPQAFLSDWWDLLTTFLYAPDVTRALDLTAQIMKADNVADQSTWYGAK
jgi:glucose/mannose transport system substrate-binding protein